MFALIFGETFVADDRETAKMVALGRQKQRYNCVTVDGDAYQASGLLTGGSQQAPPMLDKIQ